MATTIRAVFDGEVLRPERPIPLRVDATYVITVEAEASSEGAAPVVPGPLVPAGPDAEAPYALAEIGKMAIDMGVDDLAARHDWYARGTLPDDPSQ